jgi:hypothetical protein
VAFPVIFGSKGLITVQECAAIGAFMLFHVLPV